MHGRWEPTHGYQRDQPSCLPGSGSSDRRDQGKKHEADVKKLLPTLDIGSHINATLQAPPIAAATQLGKRKARSFSRFLTLPVENRTCHFDGIRLSTCDSSPWGNHEASVPLSPVPQVSTRGQLARALGTFVSLFSQARGLRRQSPSWRTRLSR